MKTRQPDVRFNFYLVEYGYQLDVFRGERLLGSECRDFSDDYKLDDLVVSLVGAVLANVERWQRDPVRGTPSYATPEGPVSVEKTVKKRKVMKNRK